MADEAHIVLVLRAIEGAGGVDQITALAQAVPNVGENGALACSTGFDRCRRPFSPRSFIFAKHPLARTRHIGGDDIKKSAQRGKLRRVGAGRHHIGMPPLGEVLGQNLCPLANGFVGHQQCAIRQKIAPKGAFSSRRRTEIEQAGGSEVALNLPICLLDEHRSGFLHIISPRMEAWIEGEGRAFGEVTAVAAPRNGRTLGKRHLSFGGIATNAHRRRSVGQSGAERARLGFTEEGAHLLDKILRELHEAVGGYSRISISSTAYFAPP